MVVVLGFVPVSVVVIGVVCLRSLVVPVVLLLLRRRWRWMVVLFVQEGLLYRPSSLLVS